MRQRCADAAIFRCHLPSPPHRRPPPESENGIPISRLLREAATRGERGVRVRARASEQCVSAVQNSVPYMSKRSQRAECRRRARRLRPPPSDAFTSHPPYRPPSADSLPMREAPAAALMATKILRAACLTQTHQADSAASDVARWRGRAPLQRAERARRAHARYATAPPARGTNRQSSRDDAFDITP